MTGLKIRYETVDFPAGTIGNVVSDLHTDWGEVLEAALTVGRPNRAFVFKHGLSSFWEAIFRCSLIKMALEQSGPGATRLRRTPAARTLDPTEKGAVNYFLGMSICKLFATKLLKTPWLLHLDVFRPQLNVLLRRRSRPDLVGSEDGTTKWHSFECKGRATPPNATEKKKAKEQALQVVSVGGIPCALHVGSITHFVGETLRCYWRDPRPERGPEIEIETYSGMWRHYYAPITSLLGYARTQRHRSIGGQTYFSVEPLDIEIGVHSVVASHLAREQWDEAQQAAIEAAEEITSEGFQPDGFSVKVGETWTRPLEDDAGVNER